MQLASVTRHDIVQVDIKGRRFLARVEYRDDAGLIIKPFDRRMTWRSATARQVIGHWRATKATRERLAAELGDQ